MSALRIPPQSIDAERAVLGGLMIAPGKVDVVAALLDEDDFYRKDHRHLFRAVLDLSARGEPCDAVTMSEWFQAQGADDAGDGAAYVLHLANTTPSAANILAYAQIVREKAMLRKAIEVATSICESAFAHGANAAETVDAAVRDLMAMHKAATNCEWTMRQAVTMAYGQMAEAHANPGVLPGVPTGLKDLDETLGGFHPSDLVVVAARPAMGKTALLFKLAFHAGDKNIAGGIISAEQGVLQVGARMVSLASKVSGSAMRAGRIAEADWPRITAGITSLSGMPIRVFDRSGPSIDEVCRVVRRWKQEHDIKIVYLDYLQRIQAKGDKRHERVGDVAMALKNLARDLNIPIVALAQVKREVEMRGDKRPRMGDICDSSDIEKEADQIITLYRDDYYNADSKDAGVAELHVEKNRHGATGCVRIAWHAQSMRFDNLASPIDDYSAPN